LERSDPNTERSNARVRRLLKTSLSPFPLPVPQGIYSFGSGAWRAVDIVPVEEDLEVPVVHPVAARVWYVQKQMRIHHPVPGAGRLLAELP
jgi:hypothetical protein